MKFRLKSMLAGAAISALLASQALAGQLVINTDTSDPAPQKAFEYLIDAFQKANPDIKVKWNKFDHEGYKSAIRNFLTADAPDLANWYAGNRMAPFVNAGLFADVSDVWKENNLDAQLKSALPSMTIDGKQWGVPYTYYQWGIYYRADIFKDKGIEPPKTWDELLAACKKLKEAGITPFAIGTKPLWPAAGWFDYLDLRTNGYQFHMDLTAGKVPYTDPRVKKVFEHWAELVKPGYFIDNAAALDWQDAVPLFAQGKAAMYLMGNFAVDVMKNAGLKEDQIGFVKFPTIDPSIPEAKKFLAFLASPETQAEMNKILGQLPVNNQSKVADDKFLKQGFDLLSNAAGLAQFYDRDATAAMAKAGMEGFQHFMAQPDDIDQILNQLDRAEKQAYK
ncbi:MAG: extracellular solute-binding protein [Rhizobiales bacterium]|nr:extracellular solute-binding protein [Hyphomicrobiales bacterium]